MPPRNVPAGPVSARETCITLTTNLPGPEARAPLFEPEGYHAFYPYPRRDVLLPRRRARRWRALVIENEFLRATVLPALGGRLFSLYDKVTGEEVFVSPERFRFGRIHMRGAWVPVGVELNFPKGHSAVSTSPVTSLLQREPDGAASIVSGAVDLVTGMHWEARFTLRPGVGRLLVHNRFSNPTRLPHGAMYWHNAAVWVGEGFRFQSRARLAYVLGEIGPFPFRNGRDYTWYRNRLWSDDLFLVGVPEDWFGYYDHERDFGALHVADRRKMPGKKFFSWGCSPDGLAWSRTFDLAGRHYGELQAGFLETQQQKRRFEPGEVFESDECWYPIADVGDVLQADERVAVGLRCESREGRVGGPGLLTVLLTESVGPVTVLCRDRSTGRVLVEERIRPRPLEVCTLPLSAPPGPKGVYLRLEYGGGVFFERSVSPLRRPSARDIERARRRIHPVHGDDAAGRVAAGDLDTRVAVRSRGEMGTLVGAFNDMVVRLAEQRSELVRLEKLAAWRGLARVLAHEIKNPLTPIQMAVQEARQSFEREDPRHGEILADCETIVLEEVAGLRNLVAGFSDFARLPEPHPRPGDFRGLAEDLDRLYGDHLRCELPDGPLPVLMDEGELRRALINLVDNGLAACAETGRPDVVILGARPASGGILEITVRDQGAGIPPENLERIFEPDFSTKKGGMGLGLPVVAGIVQGHGGTIAVDSQPGRGTTFTLTLSAAEEESCPAS